MTLAHQLLTIDAQKPERWMLFLHGILGRGANWRSFARKWLAEQAAAGATDWGAVLVDLRDHGDSQDLQGDRTVTAAAADVVALAQSITQTEGGRVAALLGHSFGGKVATAAAQQLRAVGLGVDALWIIDAPVGPRIEPRDRSTDEVIAVLDQLPPEFETRGEFVDVIVAAGISKLIAQWLATNLVEVEPAAEPRRWRFGLDLDRIRTLLQDFTRVDLWPAIEAEAAAGGQVTLVLGERSQAVYGDELARAQAHAQAGTIALATVAGAGHLVHVDNPAGLLELLSG
ncbi:alpha/beta fold hydrolase [Enhygromyxa salina]|uniref:2-succinyl-6-hydroxy-2, 4-cyclohexadiene-1-carboxylate synthase n=1 Tax=Enhygromyxa salina TaxID=215803 RepID=A0A2S9YV82_9BACT|nr:alpha/beta hydrolase [Enhygromyxa salina]PRQ09015.1 2-succinyl-6-hydroxy-2,4-cyclohexadiene-1-carboxylate synthase [Enhygromyxa salina]